MLHCTIMAHGAILNPTMFGIEEGYPARTILPEELVDWEVSLPDDVEYGKPVTNLKPEHGSVAAKLLRAGLRVAGDDEIAELARMGNADVITHYGGDFAERLAQLRYPLGRTGVNGVGVFYGARANETSDVIAAYQNNSGVYIALVKTRGRWNTPGGFERREDIDAVECAFREFHEETGHDLRTEQRGLVKVLDEIKCSKRTTDHAWIQARVYTTIAGRRFPLQPIDTAEVEEARWFAIESLPALQKNGGLSADKVRYIGNALTVLGIV